MLHARWVPPVVIAAALLFGGLWSAGSRVESAPEAFTSSVNLAPVPVREGLILINLFQPRQPEPAVLFTPEGKKVGKFVMGAAGLPNPSGLPVCVLDNARLSPDGRRLAAFRSSPLKPGQPPPWVPHLWIFDLEAEKGPLEALSRDLKNPSLAWSADGSKLFVSEVDPDKSTEPVEKEKRAALLSWTDEFKSNTKTMLALPSGHEVVDISPDGKLLLSLTRTGQQVGSETAHVIALDTLKPRRITAQPFQAMRFSPSGKEVIGYRIAKEADLRTPGVLVVASVADGSERTIALPTGAIRAKDACWSPDGKRIAFAWVGRVDAAAPQGDERRAPLGKTRSDPIFNRVTTADVDGNRSKTIFECERSQVIRGIDWR